MILALWIAVLMLVVAVVVLYGSLIEMYEQLKQLRKIFGLEDGMSDVELLPSAVGRRPSEFGLPPELDDPHRSAVVVFLSDMCATCRRLADGMRGGPLHPDLWVVVVYTTSRAAQFVEDFALTGDRVVHDQHRAIVDALGITMSPVAVIVTGGVVERAQTVPSLHQLDSALRGLGEIAAARAEIAG